MRAVKPAPTKAPKTEKEAVAAFNNAINSAKQAEHLTIGKTRTLDLTLGDTKPSLAKKAVTSALEKAIQPVDETYTVDAGSKQTAEDHHKQHEAQPVAGFGFHFLLPPIVGLSYCSTRGWILHETVDR